MNLFNLSNKEKDSEDEFLEEYTIEKCDSCDNQVKRKFREGDYVFKNGAGPCEKCGGEGDMVVVRVYGEQMSKDQRKNKKKRNKDELSSPPPPSSGPPPPAG